MICGCMDKKKEDKPNRVYPLSFYVNSGLFHRNLINTILVASTFKLRFEELRQNHFSLRQC